MALIEFSAAEFRAQFPNQFPDPPNTDALLELYWNAAICYISPDGASGSLSVGCRRQVINLTVAHLITLAGEATVGQQSGFITSGQIDKISVTVQEFPANSYFRAFMNTSPYGIQAYALLSTASVGGRYHGGVNELGSFRRAGGAFSPPAPVIAAAIPSDSDKCEIVTVPPLAPFDSDFGAIAGGGTSAAIAFPVVVGCATTSGEFTATGGVGKAVAIFVWTGSATDVGSRFNIYYWTSDARASGAGPTLIATEFDPTGATAGTGFIFTGFDTGTIVNEPNVFVITGNEVASAQVLQVQISVAV